MTEGNYVEPLLTEEEFSNLATVVDRRGLWGPADELGALNFITAQCVLDAASLITSGTVVPCGTAVRPSSGFDQVEEHSRTEPKPASISTWVDQEDSWLAVNHRLKIDLHGPYSPTHLDSLGHFYFEGAGYNGSSQEYVVDEQLSPHDVMSAVGRSCGRGILLDLPDVLGVRSIDPAAIVSLDITLEWCEAHGIKPLPGDILFVRTGAPLVREWGNGSLATVGGLSIKVARWVYDNQFSLIISDEGLDSATPQVTAVPTPWHVLALTRMGVRLVDAADLEALSDHCKETNRWTFFAVISALPIKGATSSPVTPLAFF
jgi:kynurenine formamidase